MGVVIAFPGTEVVGLRISQMKIRKIKKAKKEIPNFLAGYTLWEKAVVSVLTAIFSFSMLGAMISISIA